MFKHKWPSQNQRGAVVLVHGTGEHHGRYEHVAAYLNEQGWTVYTGDLPGWGRATGARGHIDSFSQYIETARMWTEEALKDISGEYPVFIMGHSLGGLIAARFVQVFERRHELSGLILTSPCMQLKLVVPEWKAQVARWLDRVWPTLTIPNGITPDMVSRDEQVQAAYKSDPLNYPKVSVRWFQELERAMTRAWEERGKLDIPVLIMQAGDDTIINADAVERFAEGIGPHATFQRIAGLRHEILNEPERDKILRQIGEWMNEKI
ncbi:phospholipase YtpA [Brevibacillus reuszeri]|uniref:Lipase n=1 Tax=Brevibacillus reuszeri TaxID=54915 RepID=A0A0K9YUM1_9BACL|nr:alpha/beta hydrolase [Brevibacillus reuszeri]KNB72408.1 lipase [Brevibacillus reuszeri]MED1860928.1 lysophospholipase [Brevibacillus reuszeri]GED70557.1 phospholipase YtpA [Brevibacillus reuszeri]